MFTTTTAIIELRLQSFRSHHIFYEKLTPAPVVLTGPNGSGKTNILEAISFLAPGRGLRGAKLTEIDTWGEEESWVVSALVTTPAGELTIGTARGESSGDKRIIKVDGVQLKTSGQLKNHICILSLTPLEDRVFVDGATSRREFLDRLVTCFDPLHPKRLNDYNTARSERLRLLQSYGGFDAAWVGALEVRIAEGAVAIAAARLETVSRIASAIQLRKDAPFPAPMIKAYGTVETDLEIMPALQAEQVFAARLKNMRLEDRDSGRTNEGPHRSDFLVVHAQKKQPAEFCSTGEQKALLLSLILATARAKARFQGAVPIVLLDEVVAHLDEARRAALAEEIKALGVQAWMTGTDESLFRDFADFAQFITLSAPVSPILPPEVEAKLGENAEETEESDN